MWDPLLRQEINHGTVLETRTEPKKRALFCLLDPPLHAIGEAEYRQAQKNLRRLYQTVQGNRTSPLPVGLQGEFWSAFAAARPPARGSPEAALDREGYGVVAALLGAEERPPVIQLESEPFFQQFEALKSRATSIMSRAAPLWLQITSTYRRLLPRVCSAPVAEILALADGYRQNRTSFSAFLRRLLSLAAFHEVPVSPEMALLEKIFRAQELVDPVTLKWEWRRLEQDIQAKAGRNAIAPRAALELALYELLNRHGHDPEHQPAIELYQELLREDPLSPLPDWLLEKVSRSVSDPMGEYLVHGIAMKLEDQGRPNKGAGEILSRLLELGVVLGVDIHKYETARRQVYAENLQHELQTVLDYHLASALVAGLEVLRKALLRAVASTSADRTVLRLEPVMRCLDELRAMRILYDAPAQEALRTLRFEEIWADLRGLDPAVPEWREATRELDASFATIVEFNEESLRRAKLLAQRMLAALDELGAKAAILVCDGYFQSALADFFRGEVSYSFIVPSF